MTDEKVDIQIEPVSNGQSLWVMAIAVSCFINNQVENISDPEEKTKLAQSFFAIFVFYLASFSKDKPTIANLLRITADDLEGKLK